MELNNIIIRDATIRDKDEMHELLYNIQKGINIL